MVLRLAGLALFAGLPFLGAGTATAGVLSRAAPRLQGLYAATFLGSAAGCLIALLLLTVFSAPAGLAAAAVLGFGGAAALSDARRTRGAAWGLVALAAAASVGVEVTGAAEIPFAQGRYEPRLLAVRWNPMSRVAAYPLSEGDVMRPFGQSEAYRGPVPPQIGLVVDDSGYTNLFEGRTSRENPEYYRTNLISLPFHLRPDAKALVLGPGGGKDVWIALSFPGVTVRAVEINPQVVEMVEEVFPDFTGRPYSDPRVTLTVSDGRRFAALDRELYDIIEASAVFGRLPPAAGAFTLSEDLLHTREAFRNYWDRLTPRGLLSLTRFAYEQRTLRLAALARSLLDDVGVGDPAAHVRVVSDRGLANVLVARSPFTAEEDELLAGTARDLGFSVLFPTHGEPNALTRLMTDGDLGATLASLPFDVSPPSDDRPFFYYTVRPADFLRAELPERSGFDNRGAEILRAALLVLCGLTVLAMIAPLLLRRGLPGKGAGPVLAFAAAVGVGYMALEIGTMKRVSLFLGHPVYAASATLFGFLLGSGAGSLWSSRAVGSRRALAAALCAASALGLAQAFAVPGVLAHLLDLAGPLRWMVAAGLVLPLAFVLGMAFPSAMALTGSDGPEILPWAWAVNGSASVVGSLGAVLLAMNFGYTTTLVVGAALYAAALAALAGFQAPQGAP